MGFTVPRVRIHDRLPIPVLTSLAPLRFPPGRRSPRKPERGASPARRLAAVLLSLTWLPAGIAAAAAVRGAPWPSELAAWLPLAVAAPCGLPLALAWGRLRRTGYPGVAWMAFAVLAPVTAVSSSFAGLLGPLAIAAYAAAISLPAWIMYGFLRRRRRKRGASRLAA